MAYDMHTSDFDIRGGKLIKYLGRAEVVRVPDGVVEIGEGAFTKPVLMAGAGGPPPMISWDGMENPELSAATHEELWGFDFIREVHLPESVKIIGKSAFQGSKNLEFVRLSRNLRTIGSRAFARCYKLKEIEVPVGVEIERDAFYMISVRIIRTER